MDIKQVRISDLICIIVYEQLNVGDEEPAAIGRERISVLCCLPVVVCK